MLKKASLFFVLILITSCNLTTKYKSFEQQKMLMGTIFNIKLHIPVDKYTENELKMIIRKAYAAINDVEQDMSEWIKTSPISQVAADAGKQPVNVNDEIIHVVAAALEIAKASQGAFDITFKPLGYVWDIKKRTSPPDPEAIEQAKQLVNYKNIKLNTEEKTLFLSKEGMFIGLGGIAKGYGAQKAAEVIKKAGISDFIIDAGGDLYFSGDKNGKPWVSAVKDPRKHGQLIGKYAIKSPVSMVTSGDYENFFEYEGKRYHHIIDPNTGYPAKGMRSVTVFSRDPMYADAYATAFFIIGYEKSLEIVKKNKDLAFIMVTNKNEILISDNIEDFVHRLE